MQSDTFIIQTVQQAFAKRRRPTHFTNDEHREECAEHDKLLRSRDIYSLRVEDVGNIGWDPLYCISPEGFAYYLPALARLALAEPKGRGDWYGDQLLNHLCSGGRRNERILACTVKERQAVAAFLRHLVETRPQVVDSYDCSDKLFQAIEYWSEESDAKTDRKKK